MRDSRKNKELLQDLSASLIAITVAAVVAFVIHYFFPSAWWIWLLFAAYATLNLAADLLNFGLWKLTKTVATDKHWPKAREAATKKPESEADSGSRKAVR